MGKIIARMMGYCRKTFQKNKKFMGFLLTSIIYFNNSVAVYFAIPAYLQFEHHNVREWLKKNGGIRKEQPSEPTSMRPY